MTALMIIADIFSRKRGNVSEAVVMVFLVAVPLSFTIRDYFAFRALEKGEFYIKRCRLESYYYPYARIDGKLKKCSVPYDIEGDECYLVANGDFSYFILPVNIELDDYLRDRIVE